MILAFGVASTIIILAINVILRDGTYTVEETTLLSTALGAMVGAVATYLGGRDRKDDDE
jgi:uncharacterized membrane protein YccC